MTVVAEAKCLPRSDLVDQVQLYGLECSFSIMPLEAA
jgi:hypothetical protein